ncbi:hypothetical protein N8152_00555, partial [bacterium]|nr:hypothetical protein [bacterium]
MLTISPAAPLPPTGVKSATFALAIAALLGGSHAVTLRSMTAYVTDADVTAELAVSTNLKSIKDEIDASNRVNARRMYDDANVKTLFANTTGAVRTTFNGVYDNEFGPDFVEGMLDAVDASTSISEEAKNELYEKTMMDMVVMHLVLSKIDNNQVEAKWASAAAYYIGDTDGFTTYNRANKRADANNFGTTVSSGDAAINEAIITALDSPSQANEAKIEQLFQVLYLQNVLKYAYEIDTELAEGDVPDLAEVVAEGLAFWRILKPWLKAKDSTGAATLDGIFDLENIPIDGKPTVQGARHWNYCRAKPIVDKHMATLTGVGVTLGSYAPVATDGTECPDAIPTGLAETVGEYTVGRTTYTFANDVGASLQFSEAI